MFGEQVDHRKQKKTMEDGLAGKMALAEDRSLVLRTRVWTTHETSGPGDPLPLPSTDACPQLLRT